MDSILLLLVLISVTAVLGDEKCKNVTLTAYSGNIFSPGWPNAYHDNANCWWKISAPKDHFIRLTFPEFDLIDPFWDCEKDFLKVIYSENKFDILCNSNRPNGRITSTSNVLQLQLKSDQFYMNGQGFEAQYEIVDKDGNSIAPKEVDDTIFAETEKPETSSTTTTTTTTTTTSTKVTQAKSEKTTGKKLLKKIMESSTKSQVTKENNLDDSNVDPGAMSGVVIGTIVGVVLILFMIMMAVVTVRYRRQKNKRINLSNVVGDDGETLINDGKKYQKLNNNKIVKIPTAEQFPL